MAAITADNLRKQISEILTGADLNALSAKKIRVQLETIFSADFTSRKKEIDELVFDVIDEMKKQEAASESEDEIEFSPPRTKKSRSAKTKSEPESSEDDEKLARKLQQEEKDSRRRAASKKVPSGKVKKRAKKPDDGTPKVKRENTYTKKCTLSQDLAEIVGTAEMERHNVVKKMWQVVRERELFDPSNRRYVICDEQLLKVFGTKRVLMFGMMKYLKNHIKAL